MFFPISILNHDVNARSRISILNVRKENVLRKRKEAMPGRQEGRNEKHSAAMKAGEKEAKEQEV